MTKEKNDLGAVSATEVDAVPCSVPTPELPHDAPFRVEVDKGGCERCGHGTQWTVVGPDDVAIGQSFEDEELADDIAEYMNQGYRAGCGGE
jgi:hypothetical protein